MDKTIYCYNCDTEATRITSNGTPLCETCAEAYQLGQCEPEAILGDVDSEEYRAAYRQKHGITLV